MFCGVEPRRATKRGNGNTGARACDVRIRRSARGRTPADALAAGADVVWPAGAAARRGWAPSVSSPRRALCSPTVLSSCTARPGWPSTPVNQDHVPVRLCRPDSLAARQDPPPQAKPVLTVLGQRLASPGARLIIGCRRPDQVIGPVHRTTTWPQSTAQARGTLAGARHEPGASGARPRPRLVHSRAQNRRRA